MNHNTNSIFALVLSFGVAAHCAADELVEGTAFVFPFDVKSGKDLQRQFPPKGTVEIHFDRPNGILGDDSTIPQSSDGKWRGRFTVSSGTAQERSILVQPIWIEATQPPFKTTDVERVSLPYNAKDSLVLHFYHPVRFARNQRNNANGRVSIFNRDFPCSNRSTNDKILQCWKRNPASWSEAQDRAQIILDLYDKSLDDFESVLTNYGVDEVNSVYWPKAQLQLSIADFCGAADTLANVVISENVPAADTNPAYSRPYSLEASVACAKNLQGRERASAVAAGIDHAETFVNDAAFAKLGDPLSRLFANWFELFQLASDSPMDLAAVANVLATDRDLGAHWTIFILKARSMLKVAPPPGSSTAQQLAVYCQSFKKQCS